MTEHSEVRYPAGADRQLLESTYRQASEERERRAKEAHEVFLRDSERKTQVLSPVIDLLDLNPEEVERATAEQRNATRELVHEMQPPHFEPLTGDNPMVRYAPYDLSWENQYCGPFLGGNICLMRGPDVNTGEVGENLAAFETGFASSHVFVGDWFYAQAEDIWFARVQASVWGIGHVWAPLGYASAYAGLELFIREHSEAGPTYSNTADIYNRASYSIFQFDTTRYTWKTYSGLYLFPVHANTWYSIWGGAVQHTYAAGLGEAVSNFDMYVAPISAGSIGGPIG